MQILLKNSKESWKKRVRAVNFCCSRLSELDKKGDAKFFNPNDYEKHEVTYGIFCGSGFTYGISYCPFCGEKILYTCDKREFKSLI